MKGPEGLTSLVVDGFSVRPVHKDAGGQGEAHDQRVGTAVVFVEPAWPAGAPSRLDHIFRSCNPAVVLLVQVLCRSGLGCRAELTPAAQGWQPSLLVVLQG